MINRYFKKSLMLLGSLYLACASPHSIVREEKFTQKERRNLYYIKSLDIIKNNDQNFTIKPKFGYDIVELKHIVSRSYYYNGEYRDFTDWVEIGDVIEKGRELDKSLGNIDLSISTMPGGYEDLIDWDKGKFNSSKIHDSYLRRDVTLNSLDGEENIDLNGYFFFNFNVNELNSSYDMTIDYLVSENEDIIPNYLTKSSLSSESMDKKNFTLSISYIFLNKDLDILSNEYKRVNIDFYFRESDKSINKRKIANKQYQKELAKKQKQDELRKQQDFKEAEEKLAEDQRLKNLINNYITQNLDNLKIYVIDEDNQLPIYGVEVSITSDAENPGSLLTRNGFPSSRLNEFDIIFYPNSWNGSKWGNGNYCSTTNSPCTFKVFSKAEHKIVVKQKNYYAIEKEFVPSKDGLEQVVEMAKIRPGIDINILGGSKGKVRKK